MVKQSPAMTPPSETPRAGCGSVTGDLWYEAGAHRGFPWSTVKKYGPLRLLIGGPEIR